MSREYRLWQRVERLMELARLQRAHVTSMGEGCAAWAGIIKHSAEIEEEARRLAMESGCDTHLGIGP